MKLQVIALVLTVLVVFASALPEQQQKQQGPRRQSNPGKKVPLYLDPNLTLRKIAKKDLDAFLASKEAVNELVTCFANIRKCRARSGVSLVRDVRSLGKGGSCSTCNKEEQAHTRELVGAAIAGLQQKHPVEWRRLLPEIGFLLS